MKNDNIFVIRINEMLNNVKPAEITTSPLTPEQINSLFNFLDVYNDLILDFVNDIVVVYDNNIKNDHQAKIEYEDIVGEINALANVITATMMGMDSIMKSKYDTTINHNILNETYYDRRLRQLHNNMIKQIEKSSMNLIIKIEASQQHLFNKEKNKIGMHY